MREKRKTLRNQKPQNTMTFHKLLPATLLVANALCVSCARAQTSSHVEVLAGAKPTTYTVREYSETAAQVRFIVDAPNVGVAPDAPAAPTGPVEIVVAPQKFAVKSGQQYSINSSYYAPWVQTATRDGALTIRVDSPRNATFVVEPLQGAANLLPALGAEGWRAGTDEGLGEDSTMSFDSAFKRAGGTSVRLVRGVGSGGVHAEMKTGVSVEAGQKYLYQGYYSTRDARFGASLVLMAIIEAPGKPALYKQDKSLHPLITTAPDAWKRAYFTVEVPEDYQGATIRAYVGAFGAPAQVHWDEISLRRAPAPASQRNRPLSGAQMARTFSIQQVEAKLKDREPLVIRPSTASGLPMLLDGQPAANYAFTSNFGNDWLIASAHQDFARAGVRLHYIGVEATTPERYYDITRDGAETQIDLGGPIWKEGGAGLYDWTRLDNKIKTLLGYDPNLAVGLYLSLDTPPDFGDRNPDARWVNARGSLSVGEKYGARDTDTKKPDEFWNYSPNSPAFRREASDFLRAMGRHLAASDAGKNVVAVNLSAGADGQWFTPGWTPGFGDIDRSAGNLAGFRDWLSRRYGDVAALQKAWGDDKVSFANATLPAESERSPQKYYLDPKIGAEQRVIDTNRYIQEGRVETIDILAGALKEGFGRPLQVTAYYPNKLLATGHLARQPNVDGTVAVEEYITQRPAGRTGEIETLPGTLALHGKMFLNEQDFRTENSDTWGNDAHEFNRSIVIARGPDESGAVMRRDLGRSLAQGGGAWLYSITQNAWSTPDHMEYIRESERAAQRVARRPMPTDRGQVAVFFDEESVDYASQWKEYGGIEHYLGYRLPRFTFNRSGLSCDYYTLADLTDPKLPPYKMYVFLNAGAISPAQIAFVQTRLQRDGNALLWVNNPGYHRGDFAANARALTGMTIRADATQKVSYTYAPQGTDPLSRDAGNLAEETAGPLFWVDDASATPLATLRGTDKIGLAVKRFRGDGGNWTSVYSSALGGFTPTLLRGLAQEAGLTPIGPANDVTYAGNGLLVLHALQGGEKTLKWTGRSDLLDLQSGQIVARNADSYTFPVEIQRTRWFQRVPVGAAP